MSLIWLNSGLEDKTVEGVELGNTFEDSVFKTLLEFIYQNIEPENELNLDTDKAMKIADLEQLTKFNRHQVGFVVRTFTYILRNSLQFIMKPSDLKTDLTEKLRLQEAKALLFVQLWIKATKNTLDNIQTAGQTSDLKDVSWNLKVSISSDGAQKEKCSLGQLQLTTKDGELLSCLFNHDELSQFYNQLENVQSVLDNLKK